MGSANGRHRRPRQAPAIVVAAGVTGSAIAIPLLGAAGAHAAEASTWDRVAECESGGMWSADLGNGSYGGLQFSPELWKAYGGESYAERADLASRSQQIAVAEKVLAAKGPQAWPSCAVVSGLTKDSGPADTGPGATPSDSPSRSADAGLDAGLGADPADDASSGASRTPSASASGDATGGATGDAADKSAGKKDGKADGGQDGKGGAGASTSPSADPSGAPSADPSASADPSTAPSTDPSGSSDGARETGGKHRGTPAPDDTAEADSGRDTGRHASRGDGEARDTGAREADGTYTVRPGDNLWAIAEAQELPGGWTGLYEANKDEVGSDPDLILPGQNLDLGLDAQ
ncbi:transglycosylase family protein [Streptomyces castrisilvae]|uniref:Transglycosylase family protein n=1 Tax=Streptomyces castrisilvae TaxID=3033811 RepID=A0ABY9HIA3_9ACTN|nr:transglycosylase family protein [Streptomyces sp. Mut1]WLQ34247.1 transglycosylase family protein [Streptomyces sp. Mut1]